MRQDVIDLQNDGSNLCTAATAVVEERQAGGKQKNTHKGECLQMVNTDTGSKGLATYNETQSSSSLGVDHEQCGDSSNDLNGTIP